MRATVLYADGPVGWLDWEPDGYGAQVTVDCAIPDGAPPLLRCWGETQGGKPPLLVGLPAPEDGRLRLRRRLSRETLKAAGCAAQPPSTFYLAGQPQQAAPPKSNDAAAEPSAPNDAAAEPPAPPDGDRTAAAAAPQTGDAVLDALLREGEVRAERYGEGVRLHCPFAPNRPFALAPAFALCRVEGGQAVLDWTKKDAAKVAASESAAEVT